MMSVKHSLQTILGYCLKTAVRRDHPLVIGVAGSVGKTSTTQVIGMALDANLPGSRVVASKKNFNNEIGVPLTFFQSPAPGRSLWMWLRLLWRAKLSLFGLRSLRGMTVVQEMGTDRPGDLAYLVDITRPRIGVLTAISPEHTEYFGDVEGVAREESTIVQCLPSDGIAIFNTDDAWTQRLKSQTQARVMQFGQGEEADVRMMETRMVIDEKTRVGGLHIDLAIHGQRYNVQLNGTIGRSQAYAISAALTVATALNVDPNVAILRLEQRYDGMAGRMRLVDGIKHTWLIDDSYNSSPLAAMSSVKDLAEFPVATGCRRIAVLGTMRELGSLAQQAHLDLGKMVFDEGIDLLVSCSEFAPLIAQGAKDAGMPPERVFIFDTSAEAGKFIQDLIKAGDVVLIKGSQYPRMERITKELMARPDLAEKLLVRHTPDWLAIP